MSTLVKLPDDLVEKIQDARQYKDKTQLYSLILGLKDAGYSFAELATPLGISRSAVNQWHKRALKADLKPTEVPEKLTPAREVKGIVRKIVPDVPEDERDSILNTATLAAKNNRWRSESSPERQASYNLEKLIRKHVVQRGVPIASFARHAGVSRRAIAQRVEKISNS